MGGFTSFSVIINSNLSLIGRKHYKVRQTSHVGDVVVKTLEDKCRWCTLSGYKCYSTSAIIVKFSDNICTELVNAAQVNLIQYIQSCRMQAR